MSKTFENSEMFVHIRGNLADHVFRVSCIVRCPESAPPEAPNPKHSAHVTVSAYRIQSTLKQRQQQRREL